MRAIASTSGRLHSEFVRLLFLQAQRETDLFFSGVHLPHSTSGQFHYHRVVFSSQLKSKIDDILTKTTGLRITLNIDDTPETSRSHTHPSHSETSRLFNLVSIFRQDCRCDEKRKTEVKGSVRLGYTGFLGELEHLQIETRLIDEMFVSVMGEYAKNKTYR
jgi:hypothetical protein